jgi:GntR family transcriptional repressor for pyruvate dehydrogenase complex
MEDSLSGEALGAMIAPLKRRDLTTQVIDSLRTLLERGVLQPGSKLPTEMKMTRLLGISRPSLRQAYKVLTVLGIIRSVPGDGTYINESVPGTLAIPFTFLMLVKKTTLSEVLELRVMLECEVASLAAIRARDNEIRAMNAQLEIMLSSLGGNQIEQYLEADSEFHNCIARAAHNDLLLEIMVIVGGLLRETRKRIIPLVRDRREAVEQHRSIYLAISSRDPQVARVAMNRHLEYNVALIKGDSLTLSMPS